MRSRTSIAQQRGYFSPMVFLDSDYWTKVLPVAPADRRAVRDGRSVVVKAVEKLVLVTDDIREAAEHLDAFQADTSRLAR